MKKIFSLFVKWIGYVVIFALIVMATVSFLSNKAKGKPMSLFGYSWMWVETGSMENTIPERSYILVKESNGKNLYIGDIITFVCKDPDLDVFGEFVTHRIVDCVEEGYRTKGDNVICAEDDRTVRPEDIYAVYVCNLPVLTFFGRLLMSKLGFSVILVAFVALCAFTYLPDLIRLLKSKDDDDDGKPKAQPKQTRRLDADELAQLVAEEVEKLKTNGLPPKE